MMYLNTSATQAIDIQVGMRHKLWADDTFRVATPLNTENSKKLDKWAKEDPEFYDRLSTIFPEVRAQEIHK